MGYRLLIVAVLALFVSGCAAFDSSGEPYAGFSEEEIAEATAVVPTGKFTGYYAGEMILATDSTCTSVTGAAGDKTKIGVDVAHEGDKALLTFDDKTTATGVVANDGTTLMIEDPEAHSVYIVTFAKDVVTGSMEVIEKNADGQFDQPCATYTYSLTKGEKPAEDTKEGEEKK